MATPRRRIVLGLSCLSLLGFWGYGLFDLDEGFYAAVTVEMNRRHEWLTPFYNGTPWFEKPILLYWLAKPSVLIFGQAIGPRLPSVLAAILTYILVSWASKRRLSAGAAYVAPLILGGSLLYVAASRMMLADPLLVLCLSAAFITFWESLVGKPQWRLATAFALGLGVLAKGPVALILFGLIAIWTFLREPILRPRFKGQWLAGTAILCATIATWYLPCYLKNRDLFVQKFLIEQNLNRFTGGDAAHQIGAIGLFMYPLVLMIGMAPWSYFAMKGIKDKTPYRNYLWSWALIIFLFFTVSGTKLPHYVLPCCVPLAMLAADTYMAKREVTWKALAFPIASVVAMLVITQVGFTYWYRGKSGMSEAHYLAREINRARQKGEDVVAYQLPRRQVSLGTGELKIQETSLPSLSFVLDSKVIEAETLNQAVSHANTEWIITRPGRISQMEIDAVKMIDGDLHRVPIEGTGGYYELYKFVPRLRKGSETLSGVPTMPNQPTAK